MVEPGEVWLVQVGEDHTTAINREHTKVFDLLYWCCHGRLENYMFGDSIEKKDPVGGLSAYIDSLDK